MAHPEQKRSFAPLFWLSAIVVLAALVFAIRSFTREIVAVKVAPATFQTLTRLEPTNGKVEPIQEWQAHAPAPGVVQKIYVSEGDHVSAGQLVVRMDDTDARARLASAQSALTQAKSQLADIQGGGSSAQKYEYTANISTARLEQQSASENLRAVKLLRQKGSASASEVAAAQQRLDSANLVLANASGHSTSLYGSGDRASAQARVSDAAAALAAAQAGVAGADIHTPISGSAYYIPVSEYDFVPAGEELMDVADLHKLLVRAYFDEPSIGNLAVGQAVRITWEAKPGRTWHGHIEQVPTTIISYGTRNVGECIITVDDADGTLPPHANVTVTVIEAEAQNVLSIPREALHTDGARNYVFRIVDGKLVQTKVNVGLVTLTSVEITGGLQPNEQVVLGPVTPGPDLTTGLAVKPVE
jgi:HlyD family secretion protein